MEKLNCVKEYMEKEKTDYEQENFIVNAILAAKETGKVTKIKKNQQIIDDDRELARRKQCLKGKRIMLKHLYFADA